MNTLRIALSHRTRQHLAAVGIAIAVACHAGSVLAEAGLDPTFVIGGRLNSAGANARRHDSRRGRHGQLRPILARLAMRTMRTMNSRTATATATATAVLSRW